MEAMQQHKEEKMKVVLEHVAAKCCTADAEHQALKDLAAAIATGDGLQARILTGGLANFTYCIFTEKQDAKLFAKLSFPYAQLFPDKACPLLRTQSEYEMMTIFQQLAPGCVAIPYCLLDIKTDTEEMKLLVTEWSSTNEQFGNQFIDGAVDPRTAASVAKAAAALHLSTTVSKDFNQDIRPFASSLDGVIKALLDGWASTASPPPDRVAAIVQEYGKEKIDAAFATSQARVKAQDCLIHADFHSFNILVGAKPSPETLERFPAEGNVVVCDWEFAHYGPAGRDLGPFQAFPYSCVIAHTANGNAMGSQDILSFLDSLWKEYDGILTAAGKSEADLHHAYKDSLVFCGLYLIIYCGLGAHMNYLPLDEAKNEEIDKTKESIGVLGIKTLVMGTSQDESTSGLSLADLRAAVKAAVEEEMSLVAQLVGKRPSRRNRRSSVLRSSGVVVSDAHMHLGGLDRSSFVELNRRSSVMVELAALSLDELDDGDE